MIYKSILIWLLRSGIKKKNQKKKNQKNISDILLLKVGSINQLGLEFKTFNVLFYWINCV